MLNKKIFIFSVLAGLSIMAILLILQLQTIYGGTEDPDSKEIIIPINYQTNRIDLGNNRFAQTSYLGFENYYNGSEFIPINNTIIPYNKDGYEYTSTGNPYKLYFKGNSNWGDGIKYCVDGNCLIYQSSDYSYRNQYGSQDYISNIQSSNVIINGSIFTYPNIHSGVNLTMIVRNEMLKENYVVSFLPKVPASYLGNESQITLDFGGYIKFIGLNMYVNNSLISGNFKTSEEIEFRKDNKTLFYITKPYAYDSNGSSIELTYEVKTQGNQIWFYVRTPYSWLSNSSRVYPIYIDPNTAATSPGTMADDATVGTVAWSNPDNAKASDSVYATRSLSHTTAATHYLKATNFGFAIPTGATINGILAEIERKASANVVGQSAQDVAIKIVKADGTIGTTNKASGTTWSTTEAYYSYGSSSDLWGETWDDTKINDIDFGVVISVAGDAVETTLTVSVDHIRITVYYTEGATDTCTPPAINNNYVINCSDNCKMPAFDIGTGKLTIQGATSGNKFVWFQGDAYLNGWELLPSSGGVCQMINVSAIRTR